MTMKFKFEKKLGRNYSTRSRYGYSSIVGVTLHHWGSDGQKHENVVSWLRGYTGNRNSSAHYVMSDGLVTQLVPDNKAAWHAGNNRGNGTTIGIECRPEMSAGDWATLVELCQWLESKHGSLKYYRHKDWKNTACPGRYSDRIGDLVKAINAGGAKSPAKPKPKPKGKRETAPPFPWNKGHYIGPRSGPARSHSGFSGTYDRRNVRKAQEELLERGWTGVGEADGYYGTKLATVFGQFQAEKGLDVDKLGGIDTWKAIWEAPVS